MPDDEQLSFAMWWLSRELAKGPAFAWNLERQAHSIGIDFKVLLDARNALGVIITPGKKGKSPWTVQADASPMWQLEAVTFFGWQENHPSNEILCLNANPLREVRFLNGVLKVTDPEVIAVVRKLIASGASITENPDVFLQHVPVVVKKQVRQEEPIKNEPKRERMESDVVQEALDEIYAKVAGLQPQEERPARPTPEELRLASERNREIENRRVSDAEEKVRI